MASPAAVAAFRQALVDWSYAQARAGVSEKPPGSNCVIYATQVGAPNGVPWCGTTVTACFYAVTGVNPLRFFNSLYTPTIVNVARKWGAWKTSSPLPGDWALMDWPGGSFVDHVGSVFVPPYRNIEGNTSSTNRGSQGNGDGVYVRDRSRAVTPGWVDVVKLAERLGLDLDKWHASKGSPVPSGGKYLAITAQLNPGTVKVLQAYLNSTDGGRYPDLETDGDLGPKTARKLQWMAGTPQDGVIGPASARALERWLGIPAGTPAGWYPAIVRALQRRLNRWIETGAV